MVKFSHRMDPESEMLMDLNETIQSINEKKIKYHMEHIQMVRKYLFLLNSKLNLHIEKNKLSYIALAHDLFKERGLDPKRELEWRGHKIPQDNTRYVRENLDTLAEYGLDDYFNTDVQYHALAAGIFLRKELGITDPEILYPIFFHSCPIIDIYETLSKKIQNMVDMMILADKLSSNWLRINLNETEVRIDLDKAVFGVNGVEFNYTLGVFLARLIGQGKSTEEQSCIATEFYHKRLCEVNPLICNNVSVKKLGGNQKWQKRSSQASKMH
ncbi:MAG: hypothetical protein NC548_13005 [Lachnospiraceae bacterium]|nr:hypothetical protein [Lachnospiraceae bacterium]MCM1230691.1 hypothetical protein [Ruminococcus flavefaciens]